MSDPHDITIGYARLARAVIEQTLHDVRTYRGDALRARWPAMAYGSSPAGLRRAAIAWVAHDGIEPFSCRWCCDVAEIDIRWVRGQVMRANSDSEAA